MTDMKISPALLHGRVTIPPSKSAAHRMILCAALSGGRQTIAPFCYSKDIEATIHAVRTLGAKVEETAEGFVIDGITADSLPRAPITIDCNESGSTLRFLLPIAAALGLNATFVGQGRLPSRPIQPLTDLFAQHGVSCSSDTLPLTIRGKLQAGEYHIAGNISSQYLTGLLLALPLVEGATVRLTTPLLSAGYVDMTVETMKNFGVTVTNEGGRYTAQGTYHPFSGTIEGDWSNACFFLAAAAVGGQVELGGLSHDSTQGDKAALSLFSDFGLTITQQNGIYHITKEKSLLFQKIDCSQIPDMVPALAVAAALAEGDTLLYGAERLRLKESDRIETTKNGLMAFGVSVEERRDGLLIHGGCPLHGGVIDGANDHRIVMAFSVLATAAQSDSVILGWRATEKSYPTFFDDFRKLGGIAHVISYR